MDNRGTGQSGAVNCAQLQQAQRQTGGLNGACGQSLGERAPLYSTAYAADDLAAILERLGVKKIDLYGDTYGALFESTFAQRHRSLLRSIALDGADPLAGPDYGGYPTYAPAMRDKFDPVCQRSPDCARLPGSSPVAATGRARAAVRPAVRHARATTATATCAASGPTLPCWPPSCSPVHPRW